jgi:superoxide reductase
MKRYEIYKLSDGTLLEVLNDGEAKLEGAELLEAKTADTSTEKHVPYVERVGNKYVVKVGKEQKHPMVENHYIVFIELIVDGVVHRKYLKPGDEPEAEFEIPEGKEVWAREYCNLHGLWESKS